MRMLYAAKERSGWYLYEVRYPKSSSPRVAGAFRTLWGAVSCLKRVRVA